MLQHIAENPEDYERWFQLFYLRDDNGDRITDLISLEEQRQLRDSLSRFLESSRDNVGLNVISGLIRLFLGDYENRDGRPRLEIALGRIRDFEPHRQWDVISEILEIGIHLEPNDRSLLSESFYECFQDQALLYRIYRKLQDPFSLTIILENVKQRLGTINRQLQSSFSPLEDM